MEKAVVSFFYNTNPKLVGVYLWPANRVHIFEANALLCFDSLFVSSEREKSTNSLSTLLFQNIATKTKMAHRGGLSNNLYSQYRDEEIEFTEEIEPDLSLFQIGMGDSPSYADSYAEEVSIERHIEVSSFKDEASLNTG